VACDSSRRRRTSRPPAQHAGKRSASAPCAPSPRQRCSMRGPARASERPREPDHTCAGTSRQAWALVRGAGAMLRAVRTPCALSLHDPSTIHPSLIPPKGGRVLRTLPPELSPSLRFGEHTRERRNRSPKTTRRSKARPLVRARCRAREGAPARPENERQGRREEQTRCHRGAMARSCDGLFPACREGGCCRLRGRACVGRRRRDAMVSVRAGRSARGPRGSGGSASSRRVVRHRGALARARSGPPVRPPRVPGTTSLAGAPSIAVRSRACRRRCDPGALRVVGQAPGRVCVAMCSRERND
jgi:hypothetical protein